MPLPKMSAARWATVIGQILFPFLTLVGYCVWHPLGATAGFQAGMTKASYKAMNVTVRV
jgi:hypothetical protein